MPKQHHIQSIMQHAMTKMLHKDLHQTIIHAINCTFTLVWRIQIGVSTSMKLTNRTWLTKCFHTQWLSASFTAGNIVFHLCMQHPHWFLDMQIFILVENMQQAKKG